MAHEPNALRAAAELMLMAKSVPRAPRGPKGVVHEPMAMVHELRVTAHEPRASHQRR